MSEPQKQTDIPGPVRSIAKILRVEPEVLIETWRNLRQNRSKLLQKETWQEIIADLPLRVRVSGVLVVLLLGLVIWVQSMVTSAQVSAVSRMLPERFRALTSNIIEAEETPAPLVSIAALGSTSLEPAPSPTPTPLFIFHTVTVDETVISIAAKYNITTEALIAANDIRDPTNLEAGSYLLIPPKQGVGSQQQKIMVHEVKEGDTLLSIAIKYGSSVKDILAANPHISDDNLLVGDAVAVPIVFLEANPALEKRAPDETTYHTVQPGEIPLTIAARYDIPVEILLTANNVVDPTLLQIGQTLLIPPHDGITLGFPVILYELQENDSLVGIASRFGSSVKDILAVNPDLDPANLQVGQLVAVPVIFRPPRPTPAPSAPRPTPGPPPPPATSLQQQLVEAVNARRAANGLPAYAPDAELAVVALNHAQDMYVRDFFAHVNPSGETLSRRLANAGIGFMSAGENIQRNTQPASRTVETAVNWFMNSAPHRNNILHPNHNRIGVGIVEGPPGWYTFVLVFAQR